MSLPFFEKRLIGAEPFRVSPVPGAHRDGKASHSHPEGQLAVVSDGLLVLDVGGETWMMPSGRIGWIPPGIIHAATPFGPTSGWTAYLLPELCGRLPARPAVLKLTELTRALITRISTWNSDTQIAATQSRLVDVLLDELEYAEQENLHLPVPRDVRLIAMTAEITRNPSGAEDLSSWARKLGLSDRSFTRQFRAETGMSFVQWRSMARMKRALEMLAENHSVTDTAMDLGYDSVSSFITIFKRTFKVTPSVHKGRRESRYTDEPRFGTISPN